MRVLASQDNHVETAPEVEAREAEAVEEEELVAPEVAYVLDSEAEVVSLRDTLEVDPKTAKRERKAEADIEAKDVVTEDTMTSTEEEVEVTAEEEEEKVEETTVRTETEETIELQEREEVVTELKEAVVDQEAQEESMVTTRSHIKELTTMVKDQEEEDVAVPEVAQEVVVATEAAEEVPVVTSAKLKVLKSEPLTSHFQVYDDFKN